MRRREGGSSGLIPVQGFPLSVNFERECVKFKVTFRQSLGSFDASRKQLAYLGIQYAPLIPFLAICTSRFRIP